MKLSIFKNFLTFSILLIIFTSLFSCKKNEEPTIKPPSKPVAGFTSLPDTVTGLKVSFSNTSRFGESYAWNFGVPGATSTAIAPEYTFPTEGTYTVTLVVTSADGSLSTISKTLELTGPIPTDLNLLENENFENGDNWTITYSIGDDITTTFNNKLTISVPGDASGATIIHQAVDLEPGTYQVAADFDIDATQTRVWAEFYLLATEPVEGAEPEDPEKVVGYDAFGDCNGQAYSGDILQINQDCLQGIDTDGGKVVVTTAGTYHFAIVVGLDDGNFGDSFNIKSVGLTKVVE